MFKKYLAVVVMTSLVLSLPGMVVAEKAKLNILARPSHIPEKMEKQLEQAFEKEHPNIDIIFDSVSNQKYADTILLRGATGDLPDSFIISGDFSLSNLVDARLVLSLDELFEKAGVDILNYPQNLFDYVRRDGKLYAFPLPNIARGTLHYNKDILDAEGIAYPTSETTWQEFKELLAKLVTKDQQGRVIRYACLDKYPQLDLTLMSGGQIADDPLNPTKALFGHDSFVDPMKEFLEMAKQGLMMPLTVFKALGGSKPKIFGEGTTATIITHMSYQDGFAGLPFNWGVTICPVFGGSLEGAYASFIGWSIGSTTDYSEAAFEWVRWFTLSPTSLMLRESIWKTNTNKIPYAPELKELYVKIAAERKPSNWRHVYELQKLASSMPVFVETPEFNRIFWLATWDVLYGKASLESLIEAEKKCQKILDECKIEK